MLHAHHDSDDTPPIHNKIRYTPLLGQPSWAQPLSCQQYEAVLPVLHLVPLPSET